MNYFFNGSPLSIFARINGHYLQKEDVLKIRKSRQEYRALPKGYYHLCSDGWKDGELFHSDRQYITGAACLALMTLKWDVAIYGYVLMPNHIHVLLSGTGNDCVNAFGLFVRRCTWWLKNSNCPPLPKNYGFKLISIDSMESLRSHFLYLARNPYEKGLCVPGGYCWGSDYMFFNPLGHKIHGTKVGELSQRAIGRITACKDHFPADWEIHPELGILPGSFVNTEKIKSLFPTPKAYLTRLVKDYERLLLISSKLAEEWTLSDEEAEEILYAQLRKMYPGKTVRLLEVKEKYQLAALLSNDYGFDTNQLSRFLHLSEYTILQALRAKESWGVYRR